MSFNNYLFESESSEGNKNISLEDFIKSIKDKGLFGYKIFDHISEEELKKIISDDSYFKKMKSDNSNADNKNSKLDEMVINPNNSSNTQNDTNNTNKQSNISLAVKLGLAKDNNTNNDNTSKPLGPIQNNSNSNKVTPQSFSDRMKAENERRQREREERIKRENDIRNELKAKLDAEREERENHHNAEPTFNNKSMDDQHKTDNKNVDNINDKLDKNLNQAMYAKKRANIVTDETGYKKVTNKNFDDKKSSDNLKKENDKQAKDQNSNINNTKKMSHNEYSKRTLLAIADRMDFSVYCKYRKLNGQIRTGEFKIGKTDQQITNKTDTIIVIDLGLTTDPKKPAWRTINLDKIIEIKPL
jgi:hypothetical protein